MAFSGTGPSQPMIPEAVYQATSWTFCALSLVAAAGRTSIRVKQKQLDLIDDSFFTVSVFAGIACTALENIGRHEFYTILRQQPPSTKASAESFQKEMTAIQTYAYSFLIVCFLGICCVKFSYLAFFAKLVRRQRALTLYWRFITFVVTLSSPFMIFSVLIGCQRFEKGAFECSTVPRFQRTTYAISMAANVLDIFTDLLIVSIPILLLRRVKIKASQKLALASFSCLSIFMIIIAIIRALGARWTGYLVWGTFWAQIEICLAIIMLSTTAFRQLFVSHRDYSRTMSRLPGPKPGNSRVRYMRTSRKSTSSTEISLRPFISHPISQTGPTGVRTTISGNPTWLRDIYSARDVEIGRSNVAKSNNITVRHDMYGQSELTGAIRAYVAS